MTTWTEVSDQATTFNNAGGGDDGYVLADYWVADYVDGGLLWSEVSDASTTWA